MSMTQEKMYMNVDDVCAVLGVSKAFAYYPLPRQSFTFFRPSLTSWESGVKMVSDMHYMMCIIKCLYNGGQ